MQYILTEQEYRALAPISEVEELKEKICLLNIKVMELSGWPYGGITVHGRMEFYCDDCPIGRFGLDTCTKKQQYSKRNSNE